MAEPSVWRQRGGRDKVKCCENKILGGGWEGGTVPHNPSSSVRGMHDLANQVGTCASIRLNAVQLRTNGLRARIRCAASQSKSSSASKYMSGP